MKNYQEVMIFLDRCGMHHMDLTLDRIQSAMVELENCHDTLSIIHIAGTNGKGSTAAFLESLLRGSGKRVGLYTSPHLVTLRERIQINRIPISEIDFLNVFNLVEPMIQLYELTYFEIMTLIAFVYFSKQQVDAVVLETGLGGRMDATNIVTPKVSVITKIAADHEKWLGKGVESIATEKCGIIKSHVPIVTTTEQDPSVQKIISDYSRKMNAPLDVVKPLPNHTVLGLVGGHQYQNAALAVEAAELFGVNIDDCASALENTRWAGRLEYLSDSPPVLCDGAHNPDGARALREYLIRKYGANSCVILFGGMKDKALSEMISILDDCAATWVFTGGGNDRFESPESLSVVVPQLKSYLEKELKSAYQLALTLPCRGAVVITGSLYLLGDLKRCL